MSNANPRATRPPRPAGVRRRPAAAAPAGPQRGVRSAPVPPNITRGVHGARSPGAAAAPARAPLTPKALMREAVLARAPSYSPYSRFAVGAALQGASGAVYHGCNVENASFGLTCCAERSAVFQAVSAGEQSFTAIAVTARAGQGAPPCGACRQVLAEFAPNLVVYWRDQRGHILKKKLSVLLPDQFDLVQPGGTRR